MLQSRLKAIFIYKKYYIVNLWCLNAFFSLSCFFFYTIFVFVYEYTLIFRVKRCINWNLHWKYVQCLNTSFPLLHDMSSYICRVRTCPDSGVNTQYTMVSLLTNPPWSQNSLYVNVLWNHYLLILCEVSTPVSTCRRIQHSLILNANLYMKPIPYTKRNTLC